MVSVIKERRLRTKGVTAQHVGKLAGVSQSTVSRVLSGHQNGMISEETRQRVIEVAASLGYSPNPIASALRGKRTYLLGLIIREIADPFFAGLIATLSTQARTMGYHIVLGHAHSDPEEALEMSSVLETRHCDGVILLGDLKDDENFIQKMLTGNLPIVALCRGIPAAQIPTVDCNNFLGMKLLIDHLVSLGHYRLAFINAGWLGDICERLTAFKKITSELGIQIPEEYIQSEPNDSEGGYRAMQRLLACSPTPTAVCASDDVMALGALKALQDAGKQVPGDISLAGFDDIDLARFVTPRLTTMRQPIEEMSSQALDFLMNLIAHKNLDIVSTYIQSTPELIIRESTGPARLS